jgi:hypothetical protein
MTSNLIALEVVIDTVVEKDKVLPEDGKLAESLYRDYLRVPWTVEEYEAAYEMLRKEHYLEYLKEEGIDLDVVARNYLDWKKREKQPPLPLPDAGNEIKLMRCYDGSWIPDDNWDGATIGAISVDNALGNVGVDPITGEVRRVQVNKKGDQRFLGWISDCALHIETETVSRDVTEFTFVGAGSVDNRPVKFTMPAGDLAQPQKFKAALLNAFGAENKVGTLNFDMVQRMSRNIKHLKRVEVPVWDGSIPLIPGVGLAKNVEYKLSPMTPAKVYNGKMKVAKECLRNLLGLHKHSPILVAGIMGAPAYARWHHNDRFGLALWGLTGSLKTTSMQAALAIYGTGYLDDSSLLKSGEGNSTLVGANEVGVAAGILPQSLDNVKTVDSKDVERYVSFIHLVIEGREKQRGKQDGGLRESRVFYCTPIITGEVRPEEASTTARVLNLTWTAPDNSMLTFVQSHATDMPVIGYHWLRFLAKTKQMTESFEEDRSKKMVEFSAKHYVNPGRLASNYCLLKATWELLCKSPFGDVFNEYTERFMEALDQVTEDQGAMATEETEVAKFLSGLSELIASNPRLILSKNDKSNVGAIGKWTEKGLFLLPGKTLAELEKNRVFTQKPSVDSLTRALNQKGALVISSDGKHLKVQVTMNNGKPRGWLLSPTVVPLSPPGGDAETDSN